MASKSAKPKSYRNANPLKPNKLTMGRPTLYDPAYHPDMAKQLGMLGLSNEKMAASFKIDLSTFDAWREKYVEFSRGLYEGREGANAQVANALFRRATGWKQPAVKIQVFSREEGVHVEKVEYEEHFPAEVGAMRFWMLNKCPDEWRPEASFTDPTKQGGGSGGDDEGGGGGFALRVIGQIPDDIKEHVKPDDFDPTKAPEEDDGWRSED